MIRAAWAGIAELLHCGLDPDQGRSAAASIEKHTHVKVRSARKRMLNRMQKSQAELAQQDAQLRMQFQGFFRQQETACLELEMIADGLPDQIDPHFCLSAAQRLWPLIKRAHEFEEDRLFPALLTRLPSPCELEEVIERLKFEHWGDEDFAEQVYHQIREFVAARNPCMAEHLAWTLRGFFQNLRRHIAFEREFLLPLVRECPGARL
jgi:hypothetical protein